MTVVVNAYRQTDIYTYIHHTYIYSNRTQHKYIMHSQKIYNHIHTCMHGYTFGIKKLEKIHACTYIICTNKRKLTHTYHIHKNIQCKCILLFIIYFNKFGGSKTGMDFTSSGYTLPLLKSTNGWPIPVTTTTSCNTKNSTGRPQVHTHA